MNGRIRIAGILFALLPVLACCVWQPACAGDPPPNIVVLYSDDAGYADFGFQPNVRPEMAELTPNIDSIARDGVRFSAAYMSGCVCSPSRAGLMTGRYQQRFGHENNLPVGYMQGGLPLSETLMPERLRDLGYATGLTGKWHLGYPENYQPNARGFDWFYGCLQGSRSYFPIDDRPPHRVFLENRQPTGEGGYITDRIGDGACRFIREHREKPFFLFVSFTAPHSPLQAKAEDLAALKSIEPRQRRQYAGLVKSLDDNVGKVLRCLDDEGLTANTMVVFTNDNGGQTQTGANNDPLRERKGTLHEGGVRVPMAIRWPANVPAGGTIDEPVIALDLLPTFVSAGGGTVDPDWQLDGVDLRQLMTGSEVPAAIARRTLFWRHNGAIAARQGNWKMVHLRDSADSAPELYDLATDVGEHTNLAESDEKHRDVLAKLVASAAEWERQLVPPLWNYGSGREP